MKPIKPKDISYCSNPTCMKNCERNLNTHNVVGVMSISCFELNEDGSCDVQREEK